MDISKATIKAIGVSALLIFLCSLTLLLYLWSKYDSIGDCAAIVYYNPISFKDIIYMAFICMFWYGVSLFLLKKTKKLCYITEGAIYVLLLFAFSLGGNTILESRKMHWPTEYYPRPISSKDKIHVSRDIWRKRSISVHFSALFMYIACRNESNIQYTTMAGKTKEMSQIKQLLLLKKEGISNRLVEFKVFYGVTMPAVFTRKLSRYFCMKSNSVNGNVAVISMILTKN